MSLVPELRQYEVETIYKSICSVLMALLQQGRPAPVAAEDRFPQPPGRRPTRLFMITPYAQAYQRVEDAVREVFEGPPDFFEIVLARDFMNESQLLENIRSHIDAADGFVVEISDLNPNVLLELGAVLIKKDPARPAILLRASDGKEVPADIRGELCVTYQSLADSAQEIAADIRQSIESNGRTTLSGVRALLGKQSCKVLTSGLMTRAKCRAQPGGSRPRPEILSHDRAVPGCDPGRGGPNRRRPRRADGQVCPGPIGEVHRPGGRPGRMIPCDMYFGSPEDVGHGHEDLVVLEPGCWGRIEVECRDTDQALYCPQCADVATFVNIGIAQCPACGHANQVRLPSVSDLDGLSCQKCRRALSCQEAAVRVYSLGTYEERKHGQSEGLHYCSRDYFTNYLEEVSIAKNALDRVASTSRRMFGLLPPKPKKAMFIRRSRSRTKSRARDPDLPRALPACLLQFLDLPRSQ